MHLYKYAHFNRIVVDLEEKRSYREDEEEHDGKSIDEQVRCRKVERPFRFSMR